MDYNSKHMLNADMITLGKSQYALVHQSVKWVDNNPFEGFPNAILLL